ncbi:MAG: hypothetical protein JXA71_09890 [Chitinispirillaceae bacterium]|nr:hypothetical protein [Chitinispirillaceae bacterium]
MGYSSPWTGNLTRRGAVLPALTLLVCACQFNTMVPMNNNPPHLGAHREVRATINYPDSALCTLSVEDLNDTALSLAACFFGDSTDTACIAYRSWPWSHHWSGALPGTVDLCLAVDPCSLGLFSGTLRIEDLVGAFIALPFGYAMQLSDPLNHYPVAANNWTIEPLPDSAFVGFDFPTNRLKFTFAENGDTAPASTGLRTAFALAGDLETGVLFQLRDDMREGFEVSFFISTSPLSGPWDGEKTGFRITGQSSHVRFTCFSVTMQTDSRDVSRNFPEFAGYLNIARKADSIRYRFVPGDPQLTELPMNRFSFPADTAVYVHLRMSVTDRLRTRHCLWSDFGVIRGRVRL